MLRGRGTPGRPVGVVNAMLLRHVTGATLYEDHRAPDGRGWVTLLDPEGNEFCIERSATERES